MPRYFAPSQPDFHAQWKIAEGRVDRGKLSVQTLQHMRAGKRALRRIAQACGEERSKSVSGEGGNPAAARVDRMNSWLEGARECIAQHFRPARLVHERLA